MVDDEDSRLLAAAARDPEAFAEFYRRNVGRIEAFAVRRLHDPQQVADAVATVFVTVLTASARYDPARGGAVGWLYGVAANVLADIRRRGAREHEALSRLSGRRHLDSADIENLEAQLDAARAARALLPALARLPQRDREVLELVTLDGLGPAQVAEALGLQPAAVRMRLARARRRLRHLLSETAALPSTVGSPTTVTPSGRA